MPPKRILIADDQLKAIMGIAQRLSPDYYVELANSGFEVQQRIEKGGLDMVVLDSFFPLGMDGIDIAKDLLRRKAQVKILLHTYDTEQMMYDDSEGYSLIDKHRPDDVVSYIKKLMPP